MVFGRAERATVARRPVQVVVDPLGDLEEAGVAFDHDPTGIDAHAAGMGEQGLQQLRDSTAGCGGIDVDHATVSEPVAGIGGRTLEPLDALGADQLRQPRERDRVDLDFVNFGPDHGLVTRRSRSRRAR